MIAHRARVSEGGGSVSPLMHTFGTSSGLAFYLCRSEMPWRSVFDSADQNANGSSSPASSPASSPVSSSSASARSDPEDHPPPSYATGTASNQPGTSSQIDPAHEPRSPSRRSDIGHGRHSNVPANHEEEEGEESMDLSADDIPPTILPPFLLHAGNGSTQDNNTAHNSDEDSEEEGGDMSMTGEFGQGIVSRRRTMSMAGRERRKSRMRSSITIPPSEAGMEAKEFTVSVDRPPPPENDAFKALKAIANGNRQDNDGVASEDGEVDMDVTTAVTRLLAVRNSTGGQVPVNDLIEDSFTSTEDSLDGVDAGDRTMNVTNLMGSFRASDYGMDDEGDVTMSAASMISAPISTHPASAPKQELTASATTAATLKPLLFVPASSSSALPVPVFNKPSVPAAQRSSNASRTPSPTKPTISRTISPVKQPIKKIGRAHV